MSNLTKFKVIKDIPDGFESSAKVGDILTVGYYDTWYALFKGTKAICDIDSKYATDHCERLVE